jgi:two-component sensor histidine kinase
MKLSDASVLILAPSGRDGPIASAILHEVGVKSRICANSEEFTAGLEQASCAVVAEEGVPASQRAALSSWVAQQPHWSDFPFILLTSRGAPPDEHLLGLLGNVTVLERPFYPAVLTNAVRFALRARARQREGEAHLHERQSANERQTLLIRELHHRVRNTLATVQGLLGATARSTYSVDELCQSFSSRILSLANTHNLLTDDYWQTASLREILRAELSPYENGTDGRLVLSGPTVALAADLAVPTGMAIHELTTNAARYGALSVPEGRIEVTWDVTTSDDARILHLQWVERAGPKVEAPQRKGFGSILLQRVLAAQCNATIRSEFAPEGLRFCMESPLLKDRLVPKY